jgi:imidazolonepropionase-like amidohydrolase
MVEAGIKAIKGGRLIDGTGAAPVENATVIVENAKIKAVAQNIKIPKGAQVIDATGKTVMPGMIDAHMHCEGPKPDDTYLDEISRPRELRLIKAIFDAKDYLAAGFTTIKCCGGIKGVFLKQAVAEGILTGLPRILAAGYMLQNSLGNPAPYMATEYLDGRTSKLAGFPEGLVIFCDGVDECIKATRYTLSHGADFIKIWPRRGAMFNQDELKAIVQTAAQVDKFVTVHCEDSRDAKSAILGGAKAGVIFVSTLIVWRAWILHGAEVGRSPREIEHARSGFELMCQAYKRIRKAGGIMAIGTDSGGESLVQKLGSSAVELELLVKHCDFTPMEALITATKNGALASFIGNKTGTIEPGKFADIIVVDGDPLADIKVLQDTKKIKMVMLEGKVEIEQ